MLGKLAATEVHVDALAVPVAIAEHEAHLGVVVPHAGPPTVVAQLCPNEASLAATVRRWVGRLLH